MRSSILALLLSATLVSGCSALKAAGSMLGMPSFGADKGLSIDAQIGDREIESQIGGTRGAGKIEAKDDAVVNVTTSQTDANIEQAETVFVKNYDPWTLWGLIAVITLFVPSPLGLLKRIPKLWRRTTPPKKSTKASEQKSQ